MHNVQNEIIYIIVHEPLYIDSLVVVEVGACDNELCLNIMSSVLWASGSEPICRDGPISRWRLQSMY